MKQRRHLEINALADAAGATWTLVREGKHLVIDWTASGRTVRRTLSATPSDRRLGSNVAADFAAGVSKMGKGFTGRVKAAGSSVVAPSENFDERQILFI